MAFTSNIRSFFNLTKSDPLVDSYRLLVAVELALKDSGRPPGGHDVPGMLQAVARLPTAPPHISAQLNAFSQQLRNDLGSITCVGKTGSPIPVPCNNYPFMRYGRHAGEWGGVDETPRQHFVALETTCRNLCAFLSAHGALVGVHL